MNAKTASCSESRSSEEEYIGMRKGRRKSEETKESNSEEEDIGIRNCRRKSRIDKINEEVKGWTS